PTAAALFVWAWRRRAELRRVFGADRTVRELVHGRSTVLRATRATLFVASVAFAVLSLAGPRFGSHTEVLHKRGIDLVIALDFSKSMLAKDVRPSRIERAKAEVRRLIEEQGGDRVGIVAFAGDTMEFPMTVDYSALGLFLRDLTPNDMPVGGTAIGRALVASKELLERATHFQATNATGTPLDSTLDNAPVPPTRDRVVVLITDGEDHEGEPMAAAEELKKSGVKVFTIGVGSRTGEPIPTYADDGTWTGYMRDGDGEVVHSALSGEAEDMLKNIATTTGGRYIHAERGTVGMDQVRSAIAGMRKAEHEARKVTVHEERYAWALLPALCFLLLEALLPEARLRRRTAAAKEAA
ncbi:MAG: VWA domain-containing protein, partial [Myxococcales bacterium]|nr:VWA domain-containing protein [Myxococcales bacterium]